MVSTTRPSFVLPSHMPMENNHPIQERNTMSKLVLTLLLSSFFLTTAATAGNLFPPENIGPNPNAACQNNQVLKWTGNSVACANPTDGVNIVCPTGSTLSGIQYGQAICTTCRVCVQVVDGGATVPGTVKCTPFGGGTSDYSFDPDRYDPDGVRVTYECTTK